MKLGLRKVPTVKKVQWNLYNVQHDSSLVANKIKLKNLLLMLKVYFFKLSVS